MSPFHQKSPLIFHKVVDSQSKFNKKYAPKFITSLQILSNKKRFLTYMKTVSKLDCPDGPIMLRIAKRFAKYCKGHENLDPKILSSFSSLEKCQSYCIDYFPLHFKIGKFPTLILSYKTLVTKEAVSPENPLEISRQTSKIVANIRRSKYVKNLKLEYDEYTSYISIPILLQFEKYPQKLQNFALHYKSLGFDGLRNLRNNLANLKETIQTITHLSIKTSIYEDVNLNFPDFRRLSSLSLDLDYQVKDWIKNLMSLETLNNLESFQLKTRIVTCENLENLLVNFKPPKSLKKLSLTLAFHLWDELLPVTARLKKTPKEESPKTLLSNLAKSIAFLKSKANSIERFFEEEWSPTKQFYRRWSHLDRLSHLELKFESSTQYDDVNFFFMIPILRRCCHLKSLVFSTPCEAFFDRNLIEHQLFLYWNHVFRVLELLKNTLEERNLADCSVDYFIQKSALHFKFKESKKLSVSMRLIDPNHLSFIHNLIPKTLQRSKLSYDVTLPDENKIDEFFAYLKLVRKYFQVHLNVSLTGKSSYIFLRKLVHYLESTRIEAHIHINLRERGSLSSGQIEDLLATNIENLAPTGSLKISTSSY